MIVQRPLHVHVADAEGLPQDRPALPGDQAGEDEQDGRGASAQPDGANRLPSNLHHEPPLMKREEGRGKKEEGRRKRENPPYSALEQNRSHHSTSSHQVISHLPSSLF